MIDLEVVFSPLAIAGAVAGVALAVIAGSFRNETRGTIAMTAVGSALTLAAMAWANHYGGGALFSALGVGLGATLWTMASERSRRVTIR
jgi:hypothetical protein